MDAIRLARVLAVVTSLGTFVFLFVADAFRVDNVFLVPDLVLCALLVAAAAAPADRVGPALLAAFGVSAGVLGTSVAWHTVEGIVSIGSIVGLLASIAGLGVVWAAARVRPMTRVAATGGGLVGTTHG